MPEAAPTPPSAGMPGDALATGYAHDILAPGQIAPAPALPACTSGRSDP